MGCSTKISGGLAVIAASRTVERGRILDRRGAVLARNERDENGELYRAYANQAVSQVVP